MTRVLPRLGTARLSAIGIALAIVPFAGIVLLFRDGDDPISLAGYFRFWVRVPGEFLLGSIPLCVSGAAVGWLVGRASRPAAADKAIEPIRPAPP